MKKILANTVYSDATLKNWKKEDLIEHIRILEYNWESAEQSLNIQAKNCEMLLNKARKETAEKILKDLMKEAEYYYLADYNDCMHDELFIEKQDLLRIINELAKQFDVEIKEGD